MTPANIAGPVSQFTRSLRGVQALIQAMTGAAEERMRRREYMARETERELVRGERRERFEWEKGRAAKAFEAAERERGLSAEERRQRMALVAAKYYEETGEMLPGAPSAPRAPGVAPAAAPARRAMSKPEMVDQLLQNARVRLEATGADRTTIEKAMIELGDRLAEMKTGALRRRLEMTEEPVPVAPREPTEAELAEARKDAPSYWPSQVRRVTGLSASLVNALASVAGYTPAERGAFRGRITAPRARAKPQAAMTGEDWESLAQDFYQTRNPAIRGGAEARMERMGITEEDLRREIGLSPRGRGEGAIGRIGAGVRAAGRGVGRAALAPGRALGELLAPAFGGTVTLPTRVEPPGGRVRLTPAELEQLESILGEGPLPQSPAPARTRGAGPRARLPQPGEDPEVYAQRMAELGAPSEEIDEGMRLAYPFPTHTRR